MPTRFAASLSAILCLTASACGGDDDDDSTPPTSNEQVVDCPCIAETALSGAIAGRELEGVSTGLIEPDIGDLSITLYEYGEPPVCYDSGRVEVPDAGGTRVVIRVCLPAEAPLEVSGTGGPVGTHCEERPDSATVLIADPDESGELLSQGSVEITSASGACVSGSLDVTSLSVSGGATITERLRGTFTVPNASCWSAWTNSVTKYCPMR
jgi:hypothetical protein